MHFTHNYYKLFTRKSIPTNCTWYSCSISRPGWDWKLFSLVQYSTVQWVVHSKILSYINLIHLVSSLKESLTFHNLFNIIQTACAGASAPGWARCRPASGRGCCGSCSSVWASPGSSILSMAVCRRGRSWRTWWWKSTWGWSCFHYSFLCSCSIVYLLPVGRRGGEGMSGR